MNLKNIANHLLILRKKVGEKTSSPRALLSYLLLLFIIFFKKTLKTKSIVKMFLCFFGKKQNKTKNH